MPPPWESIAKRSRIATAVAEHCHGDSIAMATTMAIARMALAGATHAAADAAVGWLVGCVV